MDCGETHTRTQGKHTNSTQTGSPPIWGSEPGPSCYEATALTTVPPDSFQNRYIILCLHKTLARQSLVIILYRSIIRLRLSEASLKQAVTKHYVLE